ncbi:MAG: helix-turn-helix domain-containing protein [Opitutaceae bacterium]|nr:helix-turn-helix domain-containing protein [Opitutaceae bacterium]
MQTIGERLEEARKKKGISLREAAEATKIRGDYLQKFEGNQFEIGLTAIYTRGFLRTYATYLKLPADRILADFAALSQTEARPRPASREIYGRMEVAPAPAEAPARAPAVSEGEAPPAPRAAPRQRTGSSLPTGPDPAVVFKWVKIGGGALIAILVVLLLNSLLSGSRTPAPDTRGPADSRATPTIGLVALRPINVTVRVKNADESEGTVLFNGAVVPGDTKIVPRPSALYIEANFPENLLIEVNGTRHPMGLPPGEKRGQLPAPPR